MVSADRHRALRRYPALAFVVAAGLLALLLPSSLRLPLSGPPSVAELAPQPSKDASDVNGDLSALGQASSGGLGGGRGTGGAGATTTEPPLPTQGRPRTKRCVGNPPRQTEDPLSPPCVATFQGDNGGATMKGVTRDEVTVVVRVAASSAPGFRDWNAPITGSETAGTDIVGKAFTHYVNDRYQLYGRQLHVFGYYSSRDSTQPASYRADVAEIDQQKHPFAIFALTDFPDVVTDEAAQRGSFGVTYSAFERSRYETRAPYLASFQPDLDDEARISASFLCRKIANRPVRYAPDQTMRGSPRKLGIVYQDWPNEPLWGLYKDRLRDELGRQCRVSPSLAPIPATSPPAAGYPSAIAQLRSDGVTTAIVVASGGATGSLTNAAAAAGYLPEWFVPGGGGGERGPDTTGAAQLNNQTVWSGAFGITFDYRRDAVAAQSWHQAFVEACPSCSDSMAGLGPVLYDEMALLAFAVQTAGPKLTPASFDKGMHAVPQRGSPSPYKPAAYFAPGNYSFVKDAAEFWWDPSGRAPSDSRVGCYRLVDDGARSRADDWTGDDGDLFSGQPACQGVKFAAGGT